MLPRGRILGLSLALGLGLTLGCAGRHEAEDASEAPTADQGETCEVDAECAARGEDWVCDHGQCMKWWRMRGEVPEVTPDELEAMIEAGDVQILDVRTRAEWRMSRIEGAYSVPIGRLEKHTAHLDLDKDRPVVAICLTAHRSIAAVRLLSREGYDIVQLQGGMTAWRKAKKERISGQRRPHEKPFPGSRDARSKD